MTAKPHAVFDVWGDSLTSLASFEIPHENAL
jgi:hypothetical protein